VLDLLYKERTQMDRIEAEKKSPPENEFYFVWIPEWDGYGNVAHGDVAFWDGAYWSEGNFPSIEDGAPVSHWAYITDPQI